MGGIFPSSGHQLWPNGYRLDAEKKSPVFPRQEQAAPETTTSKSRAHVLWCVDAQLIFFMVI